MQLRLLRRAGGALLATTLVLAACGDDATTTASDTTRLDGEPSAHSHGEGIEIGDRAPVPTLSIDVTPDAVSGANLHVVTTDFTFAPRHASTPHVPGEGHAHVYVDGEKVGRVYGEWMHLPVEPGRHEVRVDLNANDHSPLLLDGEPIEDTVTVEVPEPGEAHMHDEGVEAAAPFPAVSLEVVEDPKSGWNVRVEAGDFTFAPQHASTPHVSGEGHAHLYVDGRKVARLYGEWFHLGEDLAAGEHQVRVELNTNDHVPYLAEGRPVEAVAVVTVAGEREASDADVVVSVSVVDGTVEGGGRHEVGLGETVTVRVTSDTTDEIHVHGYDVYGDVAAGGTGEVTFTADVPGVWEVELEDAGIPLLELQVS